MALIIILSNRINRIDDALHLLEAVAARAFL